MLYYVIYLFVYSFLSQCLFNLDMDWMFCIRRCCVISCVVHVCLLSLSRSSSSSSSSSPSPVKFAGGDCWPRGPPHPGAAASSSSSSSALLSPSGDQPMEVSGAEQMDMSNSSTEASAPLPIRQPLGGDVGSFRKQAYPMLSKRPEHLRMNL